MATISEAINKKIYVDYLASVDFMNAIIVTLSWANRVLWTSCISYGALFENHLLMYSYIGEQINFPQQTFIINHSGI